MAELTAADIMTRDVLTVTPGTAIREVARLLGAEHISGVPVVEPDGRLVGIVTEGDLIALHAGSDAREAWWLAMLAEGADLAPDYLDFLRARQDSVRAVMNSEVIAIPAETKTSEIAALMISKGVNRLPVVKDGRLAGIVTRADLVRSLSMRPAAADDARAFIDQTKIGRASDRPVLDSDKMAKQEAPDAAHARRRTDRPLFP